jgi:hypothetical protein
MSLLVQKNKDELVDVVKDKEKGRVMNLTLIKNFFLNNDKKSIEPVTRVLRRSFRLKRKIADSREKRKSGNHKILI